MSARRARRRVIGRSFPRKIRCKAERFQGETILSRKQDGRLGDLMGTDSIAGDAAPSTLAFLLSQVGIYAARQFSERIAEVGLHPALFRVLNLVDAAEGRPHPTDRRVRALYLTAKGRETLKRGREIAKAHERDLTKGMPVADRKR